MKLLLRPIVAWPGQLTRSRKPSPFRSTYTDTLEVLNRELWHLGVRDHAVVQLAIREQDLRLDGELRANARPETHPGVILSFETPKFGPLSYPCDTYERCGYARPAQIGWHQNLRAIALGLEALRKVDRYGIAARGEQYIGWKQLGAGTPMPETQMTVEEAAKVLAGGDATLGDRCLTDAHLRNSLYRDQARRLHPDLGGDAAEFRRLNDAKRTLDSYAEEG